MSSAALTFAFARSSFLIMLAHRLRYVIGVVNYFVYAAVAWYLWTAVFHGHDTVAGWTLEQMRTYVCVNWIVRATYFSNSDNVLAARINKGEITSDLLRPTSMLLQFYGTALGELLFRALFMSLPVGVLIVVCFQLVPPASLLHGLLFCASVILAFHLFFAINFLTGLCAIFTEKLQGFLWAKFMLIQFLSGQLLPLEMFNPYPIVRDAFAILPFKGISYTPMMVYLGRWNPEQMRSELLLQLAWTVALLVFCELAWRMVRRRLSLMGG
ncbi:MAG: ABC-2 family transporter protein [Planctomycetota bacterium]|nr:ABC-2 family transporter protein [Planctomycetota bacterium]